MSAVSDGWWIARMLKSLRGRLFVGVTAIIVLTGSAVGGTFAYMWAYSEAIEMHVQS